MIFGKAHKRKLAAPIVRVSKSAAGLRKALHLGQRGERRPESQARVPNGGLGRNRDSGIYGLALLSNQEFEIVQRIVTGHNNRDIARELDLSEPAVRRELSHIFEKLGVADRLELALYAVNHNLSHQSTK